MATAGMLRQGLVAGSLEDVGDQPAERSPLLIGALLKALLQCPWGGEGDPLRAASQQIDRASRRPIGGGIERRHQFNSQLDWSRGRLLAQRGLTTELKPRTAAQPCSLLHRCCTVTAQQAPSPPSSRQGERSLASQARTALVSDRSAFGLLAPTTPLRGIEGSGVGAAPPVDVPARQG
jgi:hypothetical protein